MTTLYDVVVKNRHVEGGNIAVMEFESATSATLPKVEAGAHPGPGTVRRARSRAPFRGRLPRRRPRRRSQ